MKKLLVIFCMLCGSTIATKANGTNTNKSASTANARATHLSDQMIRELRLNNYQSSRLREINLKVAEQMLAIEQQYAGNEAKIKELCKDVCTQRDLYLEEVLSTVQYNRYFNSRPDYSQLDEEFMSNLDEDVDKSNNLATASAKTVAVN